MDSEEYLLQRVDDQIGWYSKKSRRNKRAFHTLRVIEIAAAALIPFLTGYLSAEEGRLKIVVGVLGLTVAIVSGLLALYRFQENWLQYRTTSEALKREKFCFQTQAAPYDVPQPFLVFVQRVEALLAAENSQWVSYIRAQENEPNEPAN